MIENETWEVNDFAKRYVREILISGNKSGKTETIIWIVFSVVKKP